MSRSLGKALSWWSASSCALIVSCSLNGASFVLSGNKMTVGVDRSGALIHESGPGSGTGIVPYWRPEVDYLWPSIPVQFYSIGVNSVWDKAGFAYGDPFNATTVNTSVGNILSAQTTGAFGDLSFTQILWFGMDDTTIRYEITFENTGTTTLQNVVYAVGLDPDQEYNNYGTCNTLNSIPDGNTVVATGANLGDRIWIYSNDSIAHTPSVSAPEWITDPYLLFNGLNDGNGDNTINMAFNVGSLNRGQTVTFSYEISIGMVPEPRGYAIIAGVGLFVFAGCQRVRKGCIQQGEGRGRCGISEIRGCQSSTEGRVRCRSLGGWCELFQIRQHPANALAPDNICLRKSHGEFFNHECSSLRCPMSGVVLDFSNAGR